MEGAIMVFFSFLFFFLKSFPLFSLTSLTATLCFSLCFSWSACLSADVSSIFPLSAVEGGRVEHVQTDLVCQEKSRSVSLFDSVCLSLCFVALSLQGRDISSPRAASPFGCCLFIAEIWVLWQQLKMFAVKIDLQLIAIFAPSISCCCLKFITIPVFLL